MLKKGQKVTVYHDPATCEKKEGAAILIKNIWRGEHFPYEDWQVRFENETEIFERRINKHMH